MNYQSYYDEEIEIGKEIPIKDDDENQESNLVGIKIYSIKSFELIILFFFLFQKHNDKKIDKGEESLGSDSDLSKSDDLKDFSKKFLNPDNWNNLNIPQEMKECFQYIVKYAPQNIEIEYILQPFIPDYVPAVGDVDAFLKISCPQTFDINKQNKISNMVENLGLIVLDEPSGHQSEPSLLNMRLKSILTNTNMTTILQTPVAKSDRDIQKWVTEVEQLHVSQSRKNTIDIQLNTNIDTLMAEWPASFEKTLNHIGFPTYNIDCSLDLYIRIICALFDIPILENTQYHYIIALHTLFNLFLATNNSAE